MCLVEQNRSPTTNKNGDLNNVYKIRLFVCSSGRDWAVATDLTVGLHDTQSAQCFIFKASALLQGFTPLVCRKRNVMRCTFKRSYTKTTVHFFSDNTPLQVINHFTPRTKCIFCCTYIVCRFFGEKFHTFLLTKNTTLHTFKLCRCKE